MGLHHRLVHRVFIATFACSALPAIAANCSALVGDHHGTFSAESKRNNKLPKKIEGSWKATIDAKCNMTGTVTSDVTGTVEVKGEYNAYGRGIGKAVDGTNMFLQDGTMKKWTTFALGSDGPGTNYVNIVNNDMAYWGSFVVEK
jgi:hypothetical protein